MITAYASAWMCPRVVTLLHRQQAEKKNVRAFGGTGGNHRMSLSSLSLCLHNITRAITMQSKEDRKERPMEKTREKVAKDSMAAAKVRIRGTAEA